MALTSCQRKYSTAARSTGQPLSIALHEFIVSRKIRWIGFDPGAKFTGKNAGIEKVRQGFASLAVDGIGCQEGQCPRRRPHLLFP